MGFGGEKRRREEGRSNRHCHWNWFKKEAKVTEQDGKSNG